MDGMYVRGDSLIIKLLFLKGSSTLCYSSSLLSAGLDDEQLYDGDDLENSI